MGDDGCAGVSVPVDVCIGVESEAVVSAGWKVHLMFYSAHEEHAGYRYMMSSLFYGWDGFVVGSGWW